MNYSQSDKIRETLIRKAREDDGFRAELLADPKAVIKKEFGLELSDKLEVQVHEGDMNTFHLALPPSLQTLSEEQLEAIAGGWGPLCG